MGLRTHTALWASGILLAAFLIGHYLPAIGPDRARIVVNSLVIAANFAVCLTWFRRAWTAIKNGVSNGAQNIHLGVWLGSFVMLSYFGWVIMLIALGRPDWSKLTPIGGLFSIGFFLAATSLLLTPINTDEEIEPISFRWWLISVALGGVLGGVIMTLAFMGVLSLGPNG